MSGRTVRGRRTEPPILLFLILPWVLVGCYDQPLLGPLLAAPHSLDRLDQETELRWLTREQLLQPPLGVEAKLWREHVQAEAPSLSEEADGKFLPAVLLPLVPIAAAFAIDDLVSQTRAESKLYSARFSATSTTNDFWQVDSPTTGRQRMVGLEIRRTTRSFADGEPACEIIFALEPASDPRLLIVRAIYFRARSSRAKLFAFDRMLDSRVQVSLTREAIDSGSAIAHQSLGVGEFRIVDYDLRRCEPRLLHGQSVAVIAAPALTSDVKDNRVNPLLTARVAVTERDAARFDGSFEQLSEQLASDRSALIAATTQPQIP